MPQDKEQFSHRVDNLADLKAFLDKAADGGKVDLASITFYTDAEFYVADDEEGGYFAAVRYL